MHALSIFSNFALMARYTIIIIALFVFACGESKKITKSNTEVKRDKNISQKESVTQKEPLETKVEKYTVHQNSSLVINKSNLKSPASIKIVSGDHLVFEYSYNYKNRQISDADMTRVIYFEIDKTSNSFELVEEDIARHKAYFGKFCYCIDTGYYPIKAGKIKGTKLPNGTWMVTINTSIINSKGEEISQSITDEFVFD
jgi:hypothetical protein